MPYGAADPARGGGETATKFSLPVPRRAAPGMGMEPVGAGRGGGEPPAWVWARRGKLGGLAAGLVPAHTARPAVAAVRTVTPASGSGDMTTGEGGGPADMRAKEIGSMRERKKKVSWPHVRPTTSIFIPRSSFLVPFFFRIFFLAGPMKETNKQQMQWGDRYALSLILSLSLSL